MQVKQNEMDDSIKSLKTELTDIKQMLGLFVYHVCNSKDTVKDKLGESEEKEESQRVSVSPLGVKPGIEDLMNRQSISVDKMTEIKQFTEAFSTLASEALSV
jgi:hypothetical protein